MNLLESFLIINQLLYKIYYKHKGTPWSTPWDPITHGVGYVAEGEDFVLILTEEERLVI